MKGFFTGLTMAAVTLTAYVFIPGCASPFVQEKVGPSAAKAIMAYCLQPQSVRLLTREEVNTLIAPNQVRINCVGDAQ